MSKFVIELLKNNISSRLWGYLTLFAKDKMKESYFLLETEIGLLQDYFVSSKNIQVKKSEKDYINDLGITN